MGQEPDRRQITTNVRSPIRLGMNLEEIEASEVQILFDGELRETRDVSPDKSEIEAVFTFYNSGERYIEMVADGRLPEKMQRLQEQDALEFCPPKAHAAWDVTVEPAKPKPDIWQVWKVITHLLALREVISIVRNRQWEWVLDRLGRSDSSDEEEEVNMTLDDFRTIDSSDDGDDG